MRRGAVASHLRSLRARPARLSVRAGDAERTRRAAGPCATPRNLSAESGTPQGPHAPAEEHMLLRRTLGSPPEHPRFSHAPRNGFVRRPTKHRWFSLHRGMVWGMQIKGFCARPLNSSACVPGFPGGPVGPCMPGGPTEPGFPGRPTGPTTPLVERGGGQTINGRTNLDKRKEG